MIKSYSKVLIRNCRDPRREGWLDLPYTEDELEEFLTSIGIANAYEDTAYDLLMRCERITKFEIVGHSSSILSNEHFVDLDVANGLVERLESLDKCDEALIRALMADGTSLSDAIDGAEEGSADFYPDMTLKGLAKEYVDEGIFSQDFLMQFIDFNALGDALTKDGYAEVNGGVLRRDN